MKKDIIIINGLKIFGYHGLYELEQKSGQTFLLNIKYSTSEDTIVDYIHMTNFIVNSFNNIRHDFLENLVERLIDELINNYIEIKYIKISIYKENIITSNISNSNFNGIGNVGVEFEKYS